MRSGEVERIPSPLNPKPQTLSWQRRLSYCNSNSRLTTLKTLMSMLENSENLNVQTGDFTAAIAHYVEALEKNCKIWMGNCRKRRMRHNHSLYNPGL